MNTSGSCEPRPQGRGDFRAGFTLVEVLVAVSVLVAAASMAAGFYLMTMVQACEGSVHLNMVGKARATEQRLVKFIESARAVGAKTNRLDLVMYDLTLGSISFIDADGDPATVLDNILELDPDTSVAGDESVLCDYVSPLPGEPMFRVLPSSPRTAVVAFQVGKRSSTRSVDRQSGRRYQAIEIRCAATPRSAR